MKQRGIGAAAIVVIIVVIVAVGVGAYFLLTNPSGPATGVGGLPVFTGASKSSTVGPMGSSSDFMENQIGKGQDVPTYISTEAYTATGSMDEILSWYRTEMAAQGWTKLYDNTFSFSFMDISMSMGLLYFEKGTRSAVVYVVEYTYLDESYLYFGLAEGPESVFDPWMGDAGYEWEEGEEGIIASATSLDFKVDLTYEGETTTYRERARNIGTDDTDLRVDITSAWDNVSYILRESQQEGWYYYGGQWYSFSDMGFDFDNYWDVQYEGFETYTGYLAEWTSGEWSQTILGITYRIYDIQVNPIIPDSVFQPS